MKRGLLVFTLLALGQIGFSQYSLTFCKEVSIEGKAQNASNSITTNDDGSSMKVLVTGDEKLNTPQLQYRIFFVDDAGQETEITNLQQLVKPDWSYAWKKITFYNPGMYRVKVFDTNGTYLTSSNLRVNPK